MPPKAIDRSGRWSGRSAGSKLQGEREGVAIDHRDAGPTVVVNVLVRAPDADAPAVLEVVIARGVHRHGVSASRHAAHRKPAGSQDGVAGPVRRAPRGGRIGDEDGVADLLRSSRGRGNGAERTTRFVHIPRVATVRTLPLGVAVAPGRIAKGAGVID